MPPTQCHHHILSTHYVFSSILNLDYLETCVGWVHFLLCLISTFLPKAEGGKWHHLKEVYEPQGLLLRQLVALITYSWSSCSIVTHLNLTILLSSLVFIVSNSNMKNCGDLEKSILKSGKSSDFFKREGREQSAALSVG